MSEPLNEGQKYNLMGIGETTTGQCPTRAELTLLRIRFSDHTVKNWESPGWRSDPVLKEGPQFFTLPCGKLHPRYSTYVGLNIDSGGHVEDISVDKSLDDASRACLLAELRKWSFYPAQHDGKLIDSVLHILFQIEADSDSGWYYPSRSEVTEPLVLVDVFPEKDVPGKWIVWYGDRPVSRSAVVIDSTAH
jgi:hypothetical protein